MEKTDTAIERPGRDGRLPLLPTRARDNTTGVHVYLEHWGLARKPFENTPDPRFFYASSLHAEALQKILYAITEEKGCALLTGEYGCGKTALVRQLADKLDPERYNLAIINFPIFTGDEFLRELLFQFDVPVEGGSKLKLFHQAGSFFLKRSQEASHNVLIIDEAQLISEPSVYEDLRLLLNLQTDSAFLVNVLLVGQPELRAQLETHPHLDSRIGIRCHLGPFDPPTTSDYIQHRLRVAGSRANPFTQEACGVIHELSGGTPRRINSLCDLCLLEGLQSKVETIREELVTRVG